MIAGVIANLPPKLGKIEPVWARYRPLGAIRYRAGVENADVVASVSLFMATVSTSRRALSDYLMVDPDATVSDVLIIPAMKQ